MTTPLDVRHFCIDPVKSIELTLLSIEPFIIDLDSIDIIF